VARLLLRRGIGHHQADAVPALRSTTDATIRDVATGAVRYAGSVAKLLPDKE